MLSYCSTVGKYKVVNRHGISPDEWMSFFETTIDHWTLDGVWIPSICKLWDNSSVALGPSCCNNSCIYGGSALLLAL